MCKGGKKKGDGKIGENDSPARSIPEQIQSPKSVFYSMLS